MFIDFQAAKCFALGKKLFLQHEMLEGISNKLLGDCSMFNAFVGSPCGEWLNLWLMVDYTEFILKYFSFFARIAQLLSRLRLLEVFLPSLGTAMIFTELLFRLDLLSSFLCVEFHCN